MKRFLKRIPGLATVYRHAMFLRMIVGDRCFKDGERMNDESHLKREWDFGSPAEQERHDIILAAVARQYPDMANAHVLEIGCSDGMFTTRLARSCASVTACDISSVALKLTAGRCHEFDNVVVRKIDLAHEAVPGQYDLVFAMDVLEFIHGRGLLQDVIKRLSAALHPGGLLAVSSCRIMPELRNAWWQRWLPEGADAVMPVIASSPALSLEHMEFHPADGQPVEGYLAHIIAVFKKTE